MAFEPLTPERRRQQTREYLLKAAEQVFAERGFHGATLDEVATVAGFTKGAVYSNFTSKDDLFLALLESRYERQLDDVRATLESSDGSPESQIVDFAALLRDQFEEGGDTWLTLDLEFFMYALRNPKVRKELTAFRRRDIDSVARIIEAERKRQGIETAEPATYAARIVLSLMNGVGMMRMIDPELVDESFLEDLIDFFYRAMTSGTEDVVKPQPPSARGGHRGPKPATTGRSKKRTGESHS